MAAVDGSASGTNGGKAEWRVFIPCSTSLTTEVGVPRVCVCTRASVCFPHRDSRPNPISINPIASHQALGSEFDAPYDPREGDHGAESRSDVYTVVNEAVGLKRRVGGVG